MKTVHLYDPAGKAGVMCGLLGMPFGHCSASAYWYLERYLQYTTEYSNQYVICNYCVKGAKQVFIRMKHSCIGRAYENTRSPS